MGLKTLSVALSFLLVLANCSNTETITPPPQVIVETRTIKQNVPIQPRPRPVSLQDVNFYVVNEENFEEFKTKFIAENGQFVFIAMSVDSYERLSVNLADIQRFILQQNEVIVYYENAVSG